MKITRRTFGGGVASFAAAAAGAAQAAPAPAAGPKTWPCKIDARTSRFVPALLTIKAGDSVEWTNPSFVLHSIDFDPKLSKIAGAVALPAGVTPFASGDLEQDQTFKHQFTQKGTYKYVCQYHEDMGMLGTLVVT